MDTKLIGDIAETSAILQSLKHGFKVSKPIGDRAKYDLIIDNDSSLFRVQVKKAYKSSDNSYSVKVQKSNTNRTYIKYTRYVETDFDFAFIYLDDLDIFYIVPVLVFIDRSWTFNINPHNTLSSTYAYKEAWSLLYRDESEETLTSESSKLRECCDELTLSETSKEGRAETIMETP